MEKDNLKIEDIPSYTSITSRIPEFTTKHGLQINAMRSGSVKIFYERRDGTKHTAMVSSQKHYNEEITRFVRMINNDFEK